MFVRILLIAGLLFFAAASFAVAEDHSYFHGTIDTVEVDGIQMVNYVVASGDCWSWIAFDYMINYDDNHGLYDYVLPMNVWLNRGVNPDSIEIGDTITFFLNPENLERYVAHENKPVDLVNAPANKTLNQVAASLHIDSELMGYLHPYIIPSDTLNIRMIEVPEDNFIDEYFIIPVLKIFLPYPLESEQFFQKNDSAQDKHNPGAFKGLYANHTDSPDDTASVLHLDLPDAVTDLLEESQVILPPIQRLAVIESPTAETQSPSHLQPEDNGIDISSLTENPDIQSQYMAENREIPEPPAEIPDVGVGKNHVYTDAELSEYLRLSNSSLYGGEQKRLSAEDEVWIASIRSSTFRARHEFIDVNDRIQSPPIHMNVDYTEAQLAGIGSGYADSMPKDRATIKKMITVTPAVLAFICLLIFLGNARYKKDMYLTNMSHNALQTKINMKIVGILGTIIFGLIFLLFWLLAYRYG